MKKSNRAVRIAPRKFKFYDLPDLRWAKALVAALSSCRATGHFWYEVRGRSTLRAVLDDEYLGAYKVPGRDGYTVRAINDAVTSMGWAAFVQAYITKSHEGYGQILQELPKGSRKVFPRELRKKRKASVR